MLPVGIAVVEKCVTNPVFDSDFERILPRHPPEERAMSTSVLPFLIALLIASPHASAQTDMPAVDPAMCDQFANMPNAPMTVEACRKLLNLAVDDPASHHPGDEAMTCDEIFAELKTRTPAGVSPEEATRDEALVEQASTMNERHAKQNALESAPESAALRAASVLPPPLGAPIAATAMASVQKKGVAATDRYMTEVHEVTNGSADIVERNFGHDPRMARLSQLAVTKQCETPSR